MIEAARYERKIAIMIPSVFSCQIWSYFGSTESADFSEHRDSDCLSIVAAAKQWKMCDDFLKKTLQLCSFLMIHNS